jgi:hypothetical protein
MPIYGDYKFFRPEFGGNVRWRWECLFFQNHLTISNLFLLDITVWVCRLFVHVLNSCGGSKMAAVMLRVTTLN